MHQKIVMQALLNVTVPRGIFCLKTKFRDSTKFEELSKHSKSEISLKELQSEIQIFGYFPDRTHGIRFVKIRLL